MLRDQQNSLSHRSKSSKNRMRRCSSVIRRTRPKRELRSVHREWRRQKKTPLCRALRQGRKIAFEVVQWLFWGLSHLFIFKTTIIIIIISKYVERSPVLQARVDHGPRPRALLPPDRSEPLPGRHGQSGRPRPRGPPRALAPLRSHIRRKVPAHPRCKKR